MQKLFAVLVAALAAALVLAAGGSAATPATAKLTIESFPDGVFGSLSGASKGCTDGRKVKVYERRGKVRDAKTDPKVGAGKVGPLAEGGRWQVKTTRVGDLYAVATATGRCNELISAAVDSSPLSSPSGGSKYNQCSPFIDEAPSPICELTQVYGNLDQEGVFNPCRFGSSSGGCSGWASGVYPWGVNAFGGRPRIRVSWHQDGPRRILEVATDGSAGRLDGWVANSGSSEFHITRGFAANAKGGDVFYTPDLPGQRAGEVGGPLKLNFENGSGTDFGAQIWIEGFLYLKR
jgi:hypothetical protein